MEVETAEAEKTKAEGPSKAERGKRLACVAAVVCPRVWPALKMSDFYDGDDDDDDDDDHG